MNDRMEIEQNVEGNQEEKPKPLMLKIIQWIADGIPGTGRKLRAPIEEIIPRGVILKTKMHSTRASGRYSRVPRSRRCW